MTRDEKGVAQPTVKEIKQSWGGRGGGFAVGEGGYCVVLFVGSFIY